MGTTTGAFGGVEPTPWMPIQNDLKLFQQEIDMANGKLAGAKPGADLTATTLGGSHQNMMNLLRSLQSRMKGLQETPGQEKGIIIVCNNMKPKLDSLEMSLKKFRGSIEQNNKMAAQGLLNEIAGTAKGVEALLGENR